MSRSAGRSTRGPRALHKPGNITGTRKAWVMPSTRRWRASVAAVASSASLVVAAAFSPVKPQLSAPTWKSGVTSNVVLSAPKPQSGATPTTLAERFWLVISTAFGRPLVPEVLVKDDQYAVVRPRVEVEQLIAMDTPAPWL